MRMMDLDASVGKAGQLFVELQIPTYQFTINVLMLNVPNTCP